MSISIQQGSLTAAILTSTIGSYIALSPPNPSAPSGPASGDLIRKLNLTGKFTTAITLAPLGLLALHTSCLSYLYPNIPSSILRHGVANGLNIDLITWSAATSIPLSLILCAGIPLRLISYASLGKNFTFALQEPDRLVTTGIYHYVQHPSYPGIMIIILSNAALLVRMDGVLSCWIPPRWYHSLTIAYWTLAPVGLGVFMFGIWTRVRQEERMLRAEFGLEWENWHANTARFIPWIF